MGVEVAIAPRKLQAKTEWQFELESPRQSPVRILMARALPITAAFGFRLRLTLLYVFKILYLYKLSN